MSRDLPHVLNSYPFTTNTIRFKGRYFQIKPFKYVVCLLLGYLFKACIRQYLNKLIELLDYHSLYHRLNNICLLDELDHCSLEWLIRIKIGYSTTDVKKASNSHKINL